MPRAWRSCLASSSMIQMFLFFAFTTHEALKNLAVYPAKDESFLTCLLRPRLLCPVSECHLIVPSPLESPVMTKLSNPSRMVSVSGLWSETPRELCLRVCRVQSPSLLKGQ